MSVALNKGFDLFRSRRWREEDLGTEKALLDIGVGEVRGSPMIGNRHVGSELKQMGDDLSNEKEDQKRTKNGERRAKDREVRIYYINRSKISYYTILEEEEEEEEEE